MHTHQKRLRFFTVLILLSIFSCNHCLQVRAADALTNKAVIFLLDASNSMNGNDKNRLAIDSIAQLIYSLPSDYFVGFVAYNNDVVQETALVGNGSREAVLSAANGVKYTGNTNAGAGLSRAVTLLTGGATEKTIVVLSDGEIFMNSDAETAASSVAFQASVTSAKEQNIKIHVIGLGAEMTDSANTIFSASAATGGINYHAPKATDLQKAIDTILLDHLQIKKSTAAIVDASGQTETVTVAIPSAHSAMVRILFTSTSPIQNLKADFSAGSVKQFSGTRYSLIEMERPTAENVNISFQGQSGSRVKVDVITEYALTPKLNVTYTDFVPTDPESERYQRTAHIAIAFYDSENPNQQVLTDGYFDNVSVPLTVDGESLSGVLVNGTVKLDRPVMKAGQTSVSIDLSRISSNLFLAQPVMVSVEEPPLLPPPPDYRPLYVGIGAGVLLLGAVLLLVIRNLRRKPRPIPDPAPPVPSKYSYSGKLNIYITRTQSGYDIPPLTYNLFRLPSGRVLSLQEILEECNIDERLEGAGKIFFKSGANRCLVITNNSDCTIMKNREILMKSRSYQLQLDSKVDITFEDEISELAFQYKDTRPSELLVGARK